MKHTWVGVINIRFVAESRQTAKEILEAVEALVATRVVTSKPEGKIISCESNYYEGCPVEKE